MPLDKLILADDDTALRETLASLLREQGFEVIEASTGEEAIVIIREVRYFVCVVTDYDMKSSVTGFEVIREARIVVEDAPGVLLSGRLDSSGGFAAEAEAACAPDLLVPKPFGFRAFLRQIASLMSD